MTRARRVAALTLTLLLALAGEALAAPFSPTISARIDADRIFGPRDNPPLRVTIRQDPGEATMRRSDVTLPRQLKPKALAAAFACRRHELEADACPPRSRVGSAAARTPLADEPLAGPVYLVTALEEPAGDTGLGLPPLFAKLSAGDLHLDLEAGQRLRSDGRIRTFFRGLPEVPVERFQLDFRSTPRGPLRATRYLCAKPLGRVRAIFVSHDGQRRRRSAPVRVPECRERPVLRASLRGLLGRERPRARIVVRRRSQSRPVRRATVRLPRLVRVPVASPWRGVRVRADGRIVPRSRWSLSRGRRLRVAVPGGADRVVAWINRGAIVTSRRGRRVFGDDRTSPAFFHARMREVGGQTTPTALRVPARR